MFHSWKIQELMLIDLQKIVLKNKMVILVIYNI